MKTEKEVREAIDKCVKATREFIAWKGSLGEHDLLPMPRCWLGEGSCFPEECTTLTSLSWVLRESAGTAGSPDTSPVDKLVSLEKDVMFWHRDRES